MEGGAYLKGHFFNIFSLKGGANSSIYGIPFVSATI